MSTLNFVNIVRICAKRCLLSLELILLPFFVFSLYMFLFHISLKRLFRFAYNILGMTKQAGFNGSVPQPRLK